VIVNSCKNDEVFVSAAVIRILLFTVSWCGVFISGVYLYCILLLILVCSNDIESNPGPIVYKTCPTCGNTAAHIKKKICPCGHVFRKKLLHSCTTPSMVTTIDTTTNVTVSNTLSATNRSTVICTDESSICTDNTNDNMKFDNSNASDCISESLQCHTVEDSLVDKNTNDNNIPVNECVVGTEGRLSSEDVIHDSVGVVAGLSTSGLQKP